MQSHQDAEVLAGLQIMTMGAMHAFKREKSKHDGGKVMDVDEQLSHLFFSW